MAQTFSRALTAVTVLMLGALLLTMILNPLTETNLRSLTSPIAWTLGTLIVIRLALSIRHLRSGAAAPVMDSASVQSQLFGYPPGSSRIDEPNLPTYTTSRIDEDPPHTSGDDPLSRPRGVQ
jgi:hypothetical protein